MIAPLVVHIVHRFDYGGLENGLVNLVNRIPAERMRHVIVALTEASDIKRRIESPDVEVVALGKRPGKDLGAYVRLFRLLRKLRPQIVHTRNFGTLDCQFVAWLSGVPARIHGEHGWDVDDPDGTRRKHRVVRRILAPFIHRFVVLSTELERWLVRDVRIPRRKVVRICNGVDAVRFKPKASGDGSTRVIGTVTRFSAIKDPLNVVRAFIELSLTRRDLRLLLVGDGPLLDEAKELVSKADLESVVRFVGAALDVAPFLEQMDVFVLGSLREGISNTVLEAMAAGLPVVATAVGGNLELVEDGVTGYLVPPGSPDVLAKVLWRYVHDPELAHRHGSAGRRRVENGFSIDAMANLYAALYCEAASPNLRKVA